MTLNKVLVRQHFVMLLWPSPCLSVSTASASTITMSRWDGRRPQLIIGPTSSSWSPTRVMLAECLSKVPQKGLAHFWTMSEGGYGGLEEAVGLEQCAMRGHQQARRFFFLGEEHSVNTLIVYRARRPLKRLATTLHCPLPKTGNLSYVCFCCEGSTPPCVFACNVSRCTCTETTHAGRTCILHPRSVLRTVQAVASAMRSLMKHPVRFDTFLRTLRQGGTLTITSPLRCRTRSLSGSN